MSEQKVWVEKMPESCNKCFLCYDNRPYWKSTDCILLRKELDEDEIETSVNENCPLHSIKSHDRELVKEVCEKIRRKVDNISMHTTTKERLMIMCEEIQQEFEDENNKN